MEIAAGEVERVDGAWTAVESAVEAVVATELVEPVRRIDAARRGRLLPDWRALAEAGAPLFMRAAS